MAILGRNVDNAVFTRPLRRLSALANRMTRASPPANDNVFRSFELSPGTDNNISRSVRELFLRSEWVRKRVRARGFRRYRYGQIGRARVVRTRYKNRTIFVYSDTLSLLGGHATNKVAGAIRRTRIRRRFDFYFFSRPSFSKRSRPTAGQACHYG